ncbi:MAG: hypothetical protein JNK61_12365 [Bacteroidia bacterium]|nr:hypothetical protein [Bacteroidia bacterium]
MTATNDTISRKKPIYPISQPLRKFLKHYGREVKINAVYSDMLRYNGGIPLYDVHGKDTLWLTVLYPQSEATQLHLALLEVYALLKTGGELTDHLSVQRIDFCTFGNSNPFRVRIVNNYNDNFDYFYVKQADASRIYGLELEHILSPNRISYLVCDTTLIEEHIAGIPGDMFIKNQLSEKGFNEIRLAKEFVKFNERCFLRLLGDMRSYNYVVDVTPDFEETHYRIRAIDFDQQSYEGRKKIYMPQFFKENLAIVNLCIKHINAETLHQYQLEEQTLMARRIKSAKHMIHDLLNCMMHDTISDESRVSQLRQELYEHYNNPVFLNCKNMGALVRASLREMIKRNSQHFKKMAAKRVKDY